MSAPLRRVGDVLLGIQAGKSVKTKERPAHPGELAILKVSAVTWGIFQPNESKAVLDKYDPGDCPRPMHGDLLISRANTRELVGAPVLVEGDHPRLLLSDKILRLVPDEQRVDRRYLARALRSAASRKHFESRAGGTSGSMTNITQDDIRTAPLRLPTLPEQRRIADILDKADAIRHKRTEAMSLTEELLRSVFIGMFGDPVTNPKGWDEVALGDWATRITKGESPRWQGFDYQQHGVRFVTSENVLFGNLALEKAKFIPAEFDKKIERSRLQEGDLLVNLVGASIGRAALVTAECLPANVNQAVAVVTLHKNGLLPKFLLQQLLAPGLQRRLFGNIVDAARANISLANIRELRVIRPPMPEQGRWTRFVSRVEASRVTQQVSIAAAEGLFESFMRDAFSDRRTGWIKSVQGTSGERP